MIRWGNLLLISALLAQGLFGQGTTSRVTGTVEDPSGAAVAGATVKLTNEGSNTSFETKTSDTGAYVFDAIQVGNYTIDVESTGFRKFNSEAIA
jgi:protocatechuate 3,4-dioxygenase beta subunit